MADQANGMDQVSIDLNLEPPVPRLATSARIALELGLGVQESEGFTHVIRQNFPRFDPRMAELPPSSFREEEAVPSAQGGTSTVNMHQDRHNHSLDSILMPRVGVNDSLSVSDAINRSPSAPTSWTPYQSQAHHPRRRLLRWPRIVRFLDEEELQTSSNVVFADGAHLASDIGRQFSANFRSYMDGQGTEAGTGPGTPTRAGTGSETGAVVLPRSGDAIFKSDNTGPDLTASYFECNICLETAKEPVVSCCGHLFCWPCIYQWLYVYSLDKECPVCKGALPDNSLTPIYGRGLTQDNDKSPGIIPPCPKAQRLSGRKERNAQNVLARNFIMTVGSEMGTERMNIQGLNSDAILSGYRITRHSQLEQRERLLLRQRSMGRREVTLRSHAAMSGDDAMSTYGNGVMNQRMRQSLETTTDGLAIVQASLDGLDATMQGLFDTTRTQGTSSGEVLEELIEPSTRLLRSRNRFVGGASGPGNVDPCPMHGRKRRRLN